MRKFASLVGAGAMVLGMAVPAFACSNCQRPGVSGNFAAVANLVKTVANTGSNSIGAKCLFGGTIKTGSALAGTTVANMVNSAETARMSTPSVSHNMAFVLNAVATRANSGTNHLGGMMVDGGSIATGAAEAGSLVSNVVNSVVRPVVSTPAY